MKIITIILASILLISADLSAQDRIDKLSDKIDRLAEQVAETNKQILETNKLVAELAKQQTVTATKVESLEKSVKERLDMQGNFMIAILAFIGVLTAGMFSFIGFVLWDRKTANQPLIAAFETTTAELKKEVNLLKEKELKHLEKEMKMEFYIRQISQIDNRFAPFNP